MPRDKTIGRILNNAFLLTVRHKDPGEWSTLLASI